LLNPLSVTNTTWDIYNSQPLAFNDLLTNGIPLSMTYRNFANGTLTANVIQYIGVFGGTGTNPAAFPTPNVYITVNSAGIYNWYLDNVLQFGAPATAPALLNSWWTFRFTRTGANTFSLQGVISFSNTWSNVTAPIYIRCGSYNTAAIGQSAVTYIDYVAVQTNATRT